MRCDLTNSTQSRQNLKKLTYIQFYMIILSAIHFLGLKQNFDFPTLGRICQIASDIFIFPQISHQFLHTSHIIIPSYSHIFLASKKEKNKLWFSKFIGPHRGRDLGIFSSPRAYIEGQSTKFLQVPRTFFRMWRHQWGTLKIFELGMGSKV